MAFNFRKNQQIVKDQRGQTLMELIVAAAVIIIGLLGVLGLTTANMISERIASSRTIATNLSREAIEVIRSIRDSNWLADNAWDQGLVAATATDHSAKLDSSVDILDFSAPNNLFAPENRLYQDNGFYSHDNTKTITNFYRLALIDPVCFDGTNERYVDELAGSCAGGESKIGIRIKSFVGWLDQGKRRQVELDSILYNWR